MRQNDYETLFEFCFNEDEQKMIQDLCNGVPQHSLGIPRRTAQYKLRRIRNRKLVAEQQAEIRRRMHAFQEDLQQGIQDENFPELEEGFVHETPIHQALKGTSTLYDEKGEKRLQWVKTNLTTEQQLAVAREVIQGMQEQIIPVPQPVRRRTNETVNTDIIPWIQIGDGHIGMCAHESQTNHNFNLRLAEEELCLAVIEILDSMPAYERVVINDLGDFTHAENYAGVTEASGNVLDMAGTFPEMIRAAVRIMRFIVNACLERFEHVDLIVNQGNHSRTNDAWMATLFTVLYEECDRLTVLNNDNVYIPYRMGNTFVMVHHSDKCKITDLARVMMCDYPEDFGESTFRYIDVGHVHHRQQLKEHPGMIVESYATLAPLDKYAHDKGYRNRSCLTVVERSKTYGEIARRTLPVEKVKDIIAKQSGAPGFFETKRKAVHTV